MAAKQVTVKIYRKDSQIPNDPGRFDSFTVPAEEGMVVLDAVHYVQKNYDDSVAARWNCKAGHCGSCSAEINGKPRLMCKSRVADFGDEIEIQPLKAFPHIKDLVTDVSVNKEIARKIPRFKPRAAETPWRMYQPDVEKSQEFRKCIECYICQDVCHVIREHKADYVGPRWVIKAASFDMHPMDTVDRSSFLKEYGGLGYCNITKCCEEMCPQHITITDNAIIQEKERAADKYYDPILWIANRIWGRRAKAV